MLVQKLFRGWQKHTLSLNGHFPVGPGLAGTRMSPFWISLELRMVEVAVTTGAIRRAKLQSNCLHQQTNTQFFFTHRMLFLSPNQQCQSTEVCHCTTFITQTELRSVRTSIPSVVRQRCWGNTKNLWPVNILVPTNNCQVLLLETSEDKA